MKKIILIAGIAVIAVLAIRRNPGTQRTVSPDTDSPTPTQNPSAPPEELRDGNRILFGDESYTYRYFRAPDPAKLFLIPNFSSRTTAADLAIGHRCISGINGGFYDTASNPLGGFMSDGKVWKTPVANRLIDGFVWKTDESLHITLETPPADALFYLQAGPLLLIGGVPTRISIRDDEPRRRSVGAVTPNGEGIFLIIHRKESVYEGPLLAVLPDLILSIGKQEGWNLRDAVNLDGGSASAFVSESVSLQELSHVGSLFCLTP